MVARDFGRSILTFFGVLVRAGLTTDRAFAVFDRDIFDADCRYFEGHLFSIITIIGFLFIGLLVTIIREFPSGYRSKNALSASLLKSKPLPSL